MSGESPQSKLILERLIGLHPKIIDLSLERLEILLEKLGRPEEKLPPTIHVAGTNGKGSVIAYLRAIFEAAEYRVHAYTSPHLVHFHERIRVSGDLIAEEVLIEKLKECEAVNLNEPITFFEITTAAAFLAFSQEPAELLLLETGLGGRLDATNVIKNPEITVITPVSMDHMQFLGNDLSDIAWEKAGIIKPEVPLVLARQEAEAEMSIRKRAAEMRAPIYAEGSEWTVELHNENFIYNSASGSYKLPIPELIGKHQISNAGLALAVIERSRRLEIHDTAIKRGLKSVAWPGRLQNLTRGYLNDLLPEGSELWLDGGHNPAAGNMLATHASAEWRDLPFHIVIGMMNTKDTSDFLRPFLNIVTSVRTVPILGEVNSLNPAELAETANRIGLKAYSCISVESALKSLRDLESEPLRVLICGSLYLAGAVLAADISPVELPSNKK